MTRRLTPEELSQKLSNLKAASIPAIEKAMKNAALNVQEQAKKNCTLGHSPYYKAPYSDDRDTKRDGEHMRDVMYSKVETTGTRINGIVGNPKPYSLWVHDGTSRMTARPFILDAIKEKDLDTRAILSKAIEQTLQAECE